MGVCHVVGIPFPGRGDLIPLMRLLESLASDVVQTTLVVTEEWKQLLQSDNSTVRLAALPNVLPSEHIRGADIPAFFQAVMTKMEAPVEQLLDQLEPLPSIIVADVALLDWAVRLRHRRNNDIPVSAFFCMSAAWFTQFLNFRLLERNGDFPLNVLERGEERVEYLPGLSSTRLVDIVGPTGGTYDLFLQHLLQAFSQVPKAHSILLSTVYELEPQAIDAVRAALSIPVYTIGPPVPLGSTHHDVQDYLKWLDQQPQSSVLYVSMGSHLSVSAAQMDEILCGLRETGVRFMMVGRSEASELREGCGEKGMVVGWCDQLRVLSHSSVGGFWSHCGWNSVKEGVIAGVPFLTFPLVADQFINSKFIVEDLRIGERIKDYNPKDDMVTRQEIATKVTKFMDLEETKSREMRMRARELQKAVRSGIYEGGSGASDRNSFIKHLSSPNINSNIDNINTTST